MTKPTTLLGWALAAAAVVGVLILASFVAGQFRGCRGEPKPPPVIPGHVDAGAPVPGPVADAPTTPTEQVIATPDLTPEEVAALAKKYGLVPSSKSTKPGHKTTTPAGTPAREDPAPEPTEVATAPMETWPRVFSEEHFSFAGVPGIGISVSAWQLERNGRIDLRGVWDPYQPPPPPPPKLGWLGNEATWEKFIVLGYVGQVIHHDGGETETKAAPGLGLGLAFKSWRFKKATLDARAVGIVTTNLDGAGIAGLGLSF